MVFELAPALFDNIDKVTTLSDVSQSATYEILWYNIEESFIHTNHIGLNFYQDRNDSKNLRGQSPLTTNRYSQKEKTELLIVMKIAVYVFFSNCKMILFYA